VGLGANLGDARRTLSEAVQALSGLPLTHLNHTSSLWRSAPFEAEGPDFFNAVVLLQTQLAPEALLRELQAIEQRHGRERPYRNAPRTLDLDLLLHGSHQQQSPTLSLPHPRMHQRAFVLEPLWEVWPDCVLPGLGPVADYRLAVAGQALARDPQPWAPLTAPESSAC
jgi:2-amino-4-hydroxy-6-hydroxymethyldihydropteridine diphosphokinase